MLYLESTLCETQSQNLIATNNSDLLKLELDNWNIQQVKKQKECVQVRMPAHQVLPLMGYIFEASYSMSATRANKIYSMDQS